MLVLSRKVDNSLTLTVPASSVPTTITVTVVKIKTKQVRLGLEAPKAVNILRSEIPEERWEHKTV